MRIVATDTFSFIVSSFTARENATILAYFISRKRWKETINLRPLPHGKEKAAAYFWYT